MCRLETGSLKKACLNLGFGNMDFGRVPAISSTGNEWFPVPGSVQTMGFVLSILGVETGYLCGQPPKSTPGH